MPDHRSRPKTKASNPGRLDSATVSAKAQNRALFQRMGSRAGLQKHEIKRIISDCEDTDMDPVIKFLCDIGDYTTISPEVLFRLTTAKLDLSRAVFNGFNKSIFKAMETDFRIMLDDYQVMGFDSEDELSAQPFALIRKVGSKPSGYLLYGDARLWDAMIQASHAFPSINHANNLVPEVATSICRFVSDDMQTIRYLMSPFVFPELGRLLY